MPDFQIQPKPMCMECHKLPCDNPTCSIKKFLHLPISQELDTCHDHDEPTVSLCPGCHCMTKTVEGKCGKCSAGKDATETLEGVVLPEVEEWEEKLRTAIKGDISPFFIGTLLLSIRNLRKEAEREGYERGLGEAREELKNKVHPNFWEDQDHAVGGYVSRKDILAALDGLMKPKG